MEIAQLIYRGRGTYPDPVTGKPVSGDQEARRLVLLLQDFILEDGERDPRQWVRHSVDLVTVLALLRSTVLTRIKGDSELYGRSLAVVPVGRIGTEEMVNTMSDNLRSFLREAATYIRREKNEDLTGLVADAANQTQTLFGQLKIEGFFTNSQSSFSKVATLVEFGAGLTSPAKSLLRGASETRLPEKIYCIGPLWLEKWDGATINESYIFEVWDKTVESKRSHLLGLLSGIRHNQSLPPTLRRPAEILHKILVRERSALSKQYFTEKRIMTSRAWLALPTDFPRFLLPPAGSDLSQIRISEPELWLSWLNRAIGAIRRPTATLPVVPRFQANPYLMLISSGDPTDLERAFDHRSFLASTELNLLNAVLFASEDVKGSSE